MKLIPLTQGRFAKVDNDDFKKFGNLKWCILRSRNNIYAHRRCRIRGTILLHREIMYATNKMIVDHRNHDTLDNRKINLRACTASQNAANRSGAQKNSATGIRGVFWYKRMRSSGVWIAQIRIGGKGIHLGVFKNIADAKEARQRASIKYFGEFCGKR